MKIITQKYLEKTGQTWNQIKDLRSPCDLIPLNEVILPFIEFESPILKSVLADMKSKQFLLDVKDMRNILYLMN